METAKNQATVESKVPLKIRFMEWLKSWNMKRNWPLYVMIAIPGVLLFIFNYVPMYGVIIAFQDYSPAEGFVGSNFVGLDWFRFLFDMPQFYQILRNTFLIAVYKIVFTQLASITFALLLNEVRKMFFKKSIQTLVYLPYFLSWVIVGGMFIDILSSRGIVNRILGVFGIESIFFLGSNDWFRFTLVSTEVWKMFGWGAIIYLAALASINPRLYEAATIDGASKWQEIRYITLPSLKSIIILLGTLSLGSVLTAGFEQVLVLYNPAVYRTGDIIDTFVYRMGLQQAQFSLAAAVDLFKSGIGFILIVISYRLAYKYADYKIF